MSYVSIMAAERPVGWKKSARCAVLSCLSAAVAALGSPGDASAASPNLERATPYGYVRESVEVRDHYVFGTTERVSGATILVRDYRNEVVDATVTSSALQPGWAYSIWVAVFNYPEYCAEPFACSTRDLEINQGDPRVKASVFYGGGLIADAGGYGATSFKIVPGRTRRELFAMSRDYGLQNLRHGEIHVVLRSHGMAGATGAVAEQIGTASAGCPAEGCRNVFASIHAPQG